MKVTHALRVPWASFQGGSKILFRALGLNLIIVGLRSLRHLAVGKGYDEPTKIAIRKNRQTALLRALIHIVPIGVALWEIIFNWNTYYVGSIVQNQALYQFGAKLHEMTAQASIAAVVFSFVRYEMSLGQGLPFGAIFSGLQVSQASYLWSMEFWGSVCSGRDDHHCNTSRCDCRPVKRDSANPKIRVLAGRKHRRLDQCDDIRTLA